MAHVSWLSFSSKVRVNARIFLLLVNVVNVAMERVVSRVLDALVDLVKLSEVDFDFVRVRCIPSAQLL